MNACGMLLLSVVCGRSAVVLATLGCVHEHLEVLALCERCLRAVEDGYGSCIDCSGVGCEACRASVLRQEPLGAMMSS